MDFARKQMESMGWKEGKGLGKNEDGIPKPLKLAVQKDSVGLGFDRNTSGLNTEVWFKELDQVIAKARKKTKRKGTGECTEDGMEVTNQKYNNFVPCNKTAQGNDSEDEPTDVVTNSKKKKKKYGIDLNKIYKKSDGVTCHRSAHVGITMSGKMKRLQEQDEQFKKSQEVKS